MFHVFPIIIAGVFFFAVGAGFSYITCFDVVFHRTCHGSGG